jgi:putative ABC transport system permease protein
MVKSLLKIAWRNIFKNGWFTFANLFSMTIGMATSILIFMWVYDEFSYDRFQANYDSIYQVKVNRNFKNEILTSDEMVFPLADVLGNKYTYIKQAVKLHEQSGVDIGTGKIRFLRRGYKVSKNFFEMFSWKFLQGNSENALSEPEDIVLTEETATALFGHENAIGKTVMLDNIRPMKVSGVIVSPPENSSFKFDCIIPFDWTNKGIIKAMTDWGSAGISVYVQVDERRNVPLVDSQINALMRSHDPMDKQSSYFVFPMWKWRLYSEFKDGKLNGGMIENVRLFASIAFVILLVACINFMNLSTARSEKRAKEVGVRKTLGSGRKTLILQFMVESVALTAVAFLFSLIVVAISLPAFNNLVAKHLGLGSMGSYFWLILLLIMIFTGIAAGSYPALYLSSFSPVNILRGNYSSSQKNISPRQILLVFQFAMSIFLLSATIVIYQQIRYVKSRQLGYNPNNLVMLPSSNELGKHYAAFKDDLIKTGLITSLTRAQGKVTEIGSRSGTPYWEGRPSDLKIIFADMNAVAGYAKTMGVKILEGREFSGGPSDSNSIMLNKAAVEAMKLKNPIGHILRYGDDKYTIVGVTDNIVMETPYKPVEPMIIYFDSTRSHTIYIRVKDNVSIQTAIGTVEGVFKKYDPQDLFQFQFVDEEFAKKFTSEELVAKISNIFSGLAIIMCLVSLAGMTSFTIERRYREIAIRKVMGASALQIYSLITNEFLMLLLLSLLIAIPLTWWAIATWLRKYTFHIEASFLIFFGVAIVILLLTLLIIGVNSLKTAHSNPVKGLRKD